MIMSASTGPNHSVGRNNISHVKIEGSQFRNIFNPTRIIGISQINNNDRFEKTNRNTKNKYKCQFYFVIHLLNRVTKIMCKMIMGKNFVSILHVKFYKFHRYSADRSFAR